MWESYTKPILWSTLVPCSTFYSTSQYSNSILTSYTVIPETSYTWTTYTSYTTISTTVVDTSYTIHTEEDTSWTTATTLTTEPILTTELYSSTTVLYETQPVSTTEYFQTTETLYATESIEITDHYSTIATRFTTIPTATTQYFQTTETLLETVPTLTIETVQTYLTSLTTHDVTETFTATVSQTPAESSSSLSPISSPAPPTSIPPPPSSIPPPPVPVTPTSESNPPVISSTFESPAPVTTPPPPPPVNPCDRPPVDDFFHVSWFGWRPVPGAEPLATIYRTFDPVSNVTVSSTFCNTPVFEKYYRTNLFDCARGCGPYQTLDNECNIVIGPVFTGPTCGGGSGYKITQRGPSGNVMDLDTSIVGHGLTVSGTCIPVTTTTLRTPFVYSGDVIQPTALAKRQEQAPFTLPSLPKSSDITPFNQPTQVSAQFDEVQNSLPGADSLFPPVVTKSITQAESGVGSPQAVTQPQPDSNTSPANLEPTNTPPETGPNSVVPSAEASSNAVLPAPNSGSTPQAPATASSNSLQGSMPMNSASEVSLSSLTCVPLSMVLPSSTTAESAGGEVPSATASQSVALQTSNAAPRTGGLSVHLGWLVALLSLQVLV